MNTAKMLLSIIGGLCFGAATWAVADVALVGTTSRTVPFDRISAEIQSRSRNYVFREGVGHRLDGVVVREGPDGTVETEVRSVSNVDGTTKVADVTITSKAAWQEYSLFLAGPRISFSKPAVLGPDAKTSDLTAPEVEKLAKLALVSFKEATVREPLAEIEASRVVGSRVDAVGVTVDYKQFGSLVRGLLWGLVGLLGYLALIHVLFLRRVIRATWYAFYMIGYVLMELAVAIAS